MKKSGSCNVCGASTDEGFDGKPMMLCKSCQEKHKAQMEGKTRLSHDQGASSEHKTPESNNILDWFKELPTAGKVGVFFGAAILLTMFDSQKESDSISESQKRSICKNYIAGVFGRSPQIMRISDVKSDSSGGFFAEVYYRRPEDNSKWTNICHIYGDSVVWAAVLEDGSLGRWRWEDEKAL